MEHRQDRHRRRKLIRLLREMSFPHSLGLLVLLSGTGLAPFIYTML